jgi:hypothetical protein
MSEKKKRGRKPKNKIVVNENPNFNTNKKLDNLIVCLKKKSHPPNKNLLPGYDNLNYEMNEMNEMDEMDEMNESDTNGIGKYCWNCCHTYTQCHTIPLNYGNDIFHMYGEFCSFGCSARYIFDTYINHDLWDKYSLLNLYYNISRNTQNDIVKLAPNKLHLKKFGGYLTIDEYRKKTTSVYKDIKLSPIIPINHSYYNHDNKIKYNDSVNDLKLYRKNPTKNKNNIYHSMNIDKI